MDDSGFEGTDPIRIRVTVTPGDGRLRVDFTGTSPQQQTNFNAPEPVARAAVLYVFRVMVDDEIPMNAGCLRPINIIIPPRCMLRPEYPAAVVAGNVETSQAVTDTLFGALGAMAAAQGTMNNLNFGNPEHPEVMWQFSEVVDGMSEACEALGMPVIGGNVDYGELYADRYLTEQAAKEGHAKVLAEWSVK